MFTSVFVKTRELSEQGDKLVREIGVSGDTCFLTEDGRAKAVLIDIQHYNALMDLVEESETPREAKKPEFERSVSVRGILNERTRPSPHLPHA